MIKTFKGLRGTATLMLGDCLAILPTLEGVDAVVSDVPYGHGYVAGTACLSNKGNWKPKKGPQEMNWNLEPFDPAPILALDVPTVLWGANHFASRLPDSPAWLVWDKRGGTAENNLSDCELAWCLRTGRNFIGIEIDPKHFQTACERMAREIDGELL